ncbi:hypothetical protein F0562_025646 [Nyssa sinensis]|uniref:Uncharacterized protein n=1 Tax=Nyssa sinensis TaxID=561372 RepID=A0A5J5B8L1_9ASTE|nr:hypothetical protein F0562_025646 [Nyssa sinensis]
MISSLATISHFIILQRRLINGYCGYSSGLRCLIVDRRFSLLTPQNRLDPDDTPNVSPLLWQPSFLTWTSLVTVNNSVMQDDPIAAAVVALGLVSPCDKGLLAAKTDANVVYDSLVLCIRVMNFVSNLARRLYARDAMIRSLNDHIAVLQ